MSKRQFNCVADEVKFKVGYDVYAKEPLFYLESKLECITLHLTPIELRKLIDKMTILCENMEQK